MSAMAGRFCLLKTTASVSIFKPMGERFLICTRFFIRGTKAKVSGSILSKPKLNHLGGI